jgi:Ca-activated chloride channel homolog
MAAGRGREGISHRQSNHREDTAVPEPHIDLVPLRPAVCCDAAVTLDVLVRVTAPAPEGVARRPAINLGLVLDRSGSMASGNKMDHARRAAVFAVRHLLPSDRVSVTVFDNKVETVVPSAPAADTERVVAALERVQPRGSTALHGGWAEGAEQVREHLRPGGLNRVLLLSDGLANVGETHPDTIAGDVHRLAGAGVSTTTLGVGDDYNEDLLEAMASSGDGNYYYIDSPERLPEIFQAELHGLTATFGHRASLGVEPRGGVEVEDVLNELERTPAGRLKLPNLVGGVPVLVLVRLRVPPVAQAAELCPTALCRFRLAWDGTDRPGRQRQEVALHLPVVNAAAWETLPVNPEVKERAALLEMARAKKQAAVCAELHDRAGAAHWLGEARRLLLNVPATVETLSEDQALAQIEADLAGGAREKFVKRVKCQNFQRNRSQRYT